MNQQTIMIVDGDHVSLTLLTKLVEKLDYRVVQARDSEEALLMLKAQPLDVIISDYEMPNSNGLALLKAVKSEYPSLPFILVTAYTNVQVIREAWLAGAFDFFQKPVFIDRLNQTIHLAIGYGHLSIARRRFPRLEANTTDPTVVDLSVLKELAAALEAADLAAVVAEYEVHANIELEQLFRLSFARQYPAVKALAHRLAGTSINLGLTRMTAEFRAIEANPKKPFNNPVELEMLLHRSVYFLKLALSDIIHDLAS